MTFLFSFFLDLFPFMYNMELLIQDITWIPPVLFGKLFFKRGEGLYSFQESSQILLKMKIVDHSLKSKNNLFEELFRDILYFAYQVRN